MTRIARQTSIFDSRLADAIALWLRRAPRRILVELAEGEAGDGAAAALAGIIVAELTMAYPEYVESVEPNADQLKLAL